MGGLRGEGEGAADCAVGQETGGGDEGVGAALGLGLACDDEQEVLALAGSGHDVHLADAAEGAHGSCYVEHGG